MTREPPTPCGPVVIRTFKELDFTVRITPFSHYVHYDIFNIDYFQHVEGEGEVPFWDRKDSHTNGNGVRSLDEAELYIQGTVKWDGCSDWIFEDAKLHHGCNREDLARVGDVMAICWEMNDEFCPHWDQINIGNTASRDLAITKMKLMFPGISEKSLGCLVDIALILDKSKPVDDQSIADLRAAADTL